MRKVSSYKCPHCGKKYMSLQTWGNHVYSQHSGLVPQDWSYARYFYFLQTGKNHGTCIICKKDTEWNEATQKYERFCNNPECKQKYREMFKQRMIQKYGKVTLLNDEQQQRKMLQKRRISGKYKFSNGTIIPYTGSYEKDFLIFLDTFLHFDPNDLMMPSPHTYEYDYKNPNDKENEGKHFYIPDAFIPSINLEIEIKQGTNTHPKMLKVDAIKTLEKDEMMKTIKGIHYIRIIDKDYTKFMDLLTELGTANFEVESSIAQEGSIKFTEYNDLYVSKGKRRLSEFKFTKVDIQSISAFKKEYPSLKHIRIGKDTNGEMVIDNGKVVGYYQTQKRDNAVWLISFEIMEEYKGYGLSAQLLRRAIQKTNITNLSVNPQNEVAIKLYKSFGFKEYKLSDKMIFMARN